MVFRAAVSFFKSAQHIQRALDGGALRLHFSLPVYYLYSHAIELLLKAFLRSNGVDRGRLASREYGHDLMALWAACLGQGFRCDEPILAHAAETIALLSPYATSFEFRYPLVGYKSLPSLEDVEQTCAALMIAIRPHCELRQPRD